MDSFIKYRFVLGHGDTRASFFILETEKYREILTLYLSARVGINVVCYMVEKKVAASPHSVSILGRWTQRNKS